MQRSTLRSVRMFVIASLMTLVSAPAVAQSTFATLTGTVLDGSGAVLPGVAITVTNTRTQATRTAVTDDVGNYLLPNLDAGEYRIAAALAGFADQTRHIELLARQTIRVDLQ